MRITMKADQQIKYVTGNAARMAQTLHANELGFVLHGKHTRKRISK